MIPKKIHYCWFGGKKLPDSAQKCINSWKKFFPDYEIIEWNESNYDVNKMIYTRQAYEAGKYAFVSDYARFDILYRHGGVYFDTDVEVIKPFDDILSKGAFMGCEIDGFYAQEEDMLSVDSSVKRIQVAPGLGIAVNPGLGIAVNPGLGIYKEILDFYSTQSFICGDGTLNLETVVVKTTEILAAHGLKNIGGLQTIEGITIYPKEYFNPLNNNTGKIEITENTHSIHWYTMTWADSKDVVKSKITRVCHRLFGEDCFNFLKHCKK